MNMQNPLINHFRSTITINHLVGNVEQRTIETLRHQLGIIRSEVEELRQGITMDDVHEMRDGVADVLFTIAGLYGRMGFALPEHLYTDTSFASVGRCMTAVERHMATLDVLSSLTFESVYVAIQETAASMTEWVYQLGQVAGFDVLADFDAVITSNWTKFDQSESDAKLTALKYDMIGVRTHYTKCVSPDTQQTYYVTFSSETQKGLDGKEYPGGKWLKSCHFKDTNFSESLPPPPVEITLPELAIEQAVASHQELFNGPITMPASDVTAVFTQLDQLSDTRRYNITDFTVQTTDPATGFTVVQDAKPFP
jgi:hypothetical protein